MKFYTVDGSQIWLGEEGIYCQNCWYTLGNGCEDWQRIEYYSKQIRPGGNESCKKCKILNSDPTTALEFDKALMQKQSEELNKKKEKEIIITKIMKRLIDFEKNPPGSYKWTKVNHILNEMDLNKLKSLISE